MFANISLSILSEWVRAPTLVLHSILDYGGCHPVNVYTEPTLGIGGHVRLVNWHWQIAHTSGVEEFSEKVRVEADEWRDDCRSETMIESNFLTNEIWKLVCQFPLNNPPQMQEIQYVLRDDDPLCRLLSRTLRNSPFVLFSKLYDFIDGTS